MKNLLLLLLLVVSCPLFAQPKLPDKFAFTSNPIELTRTARPREYIEAVGRKAAMFGHENGVFEAWAFPMKLLHDARLSILVEGQDSPVEFGDNIERIITRPEATTLIASNQLFTLRAHFLTPIDEAGSLILLDVDTARPLTITVSFVPDMKPMWPGGLGGQSAGWRDDLKAFVISESRRKFNAFFGSPAATKGIATPAHQLASGALRFDLKVDPQQAKKSFYPLIIAASTKDRQAAIDLYNRLSNTIPEQYQKTFAHYRRLRDEMLSIETPDEKLNLAFEWAKVSLDKGLIDNPDLSLGLVAGWNATGNGARPGFGWFFGGDAAMNSYAMTAYGDWENVKATFRFLAKYQRADGKIPHEISQSAGMIKWFEEYPYAYYHADTTPFYLAAVYNYYAQSGDAEFIRELWPTLKKAYQFCVENDTDGDGILENSKAGLGASELGSLLNDLHQDIYLAATNTEASRAMMELAKLMNDGPLRETAEEKYRQSSRTIQARYWNSTEKRFAYALTKNGQQNMEVTAWAALPMMFGQLDRQRVEKTLDDLVSAQISSDWGTRMLSKQSPAYDPMAYNNGGVWPFLTGFVALAEYQYWRPQAGFAHLKQIANLPFDFALGYHPEILSGDYYRPLDESVPHQLFSSGMVVTAFVRGMLGLQADAAENKLRYFMQLPASWNSLKVRNYRLQGQRLELEFSRISASKIRCEVRRNSDTPLTINPSFSQGFGLDNNRLYFNGKPLEAKAPHLIADKEKGKIFPIIDNGLRPNDPIFWGLQVPMGKTLVYEMTFDNAFAIEAVPSPLQIGDPTSSLKVLEVAPRGNNKIVLRLEGLAGKNYLLRLRSTMTFAAITGAVLKEKKDDWQWLEVPIPASEKGGWHITTVEMVYK